MSDLVLLFVVSVDYVIPEGSHSSLIYHHVTKAIQLPSYENYFDHDLLTRDSKPELLLTPELV